MDRVEKSLVSPKGARFDSPGRVSPGLTHSTRSRQPQRGGIPLCVRRSSPPRISPRWGFWLLFDIYPGLAPWAIESRPVGAIPMNARIKSGIQNDHPCVLVFSAEPAPADHLAERDDYISIPSVAVSCANRALSRAVIGPDLPAPIGRPSTRITGVSSPIVPVQNISSAR